MKSMIGIAAAALVSLSGAAEEPSLSLWYRSPAREWREALPVGNGRLGAMIFGGATENRIQFNEHTVWTGAPHCYAHSNAVAVLPELRKLVREERHKEAKVLAMERFMSVPLRQERFQPCGDLLVTLAGVTSVTNYVRSLDLTQAVHRVAFDASGVRYRQETFASYPDNVLVHRVAADKPGALGCAIRLSSPHSVARLEAKDSGWLALAGLVQTNGVAFEAQAVVWAEGRGARVVAENGHLAVSGADAVEIRLAVATNVKAWNALGADPATACRSTLRRIDRKRFDALLARHAADHAKLFGRVELELPRTAASARPTDERLRSCRAAEDPDFAALVFQYGRYLLIACSRPGGQPANLQGIWNDSLTPPWDSKYTCNINTEMNYWPAEVTALPECHQPLFAAVNELAESGRVTAREHYGARGWVVHHNFDLWRGTAPINNANHGIWVGGSGWLALHLWEHYLFSRDKGFLRMHAWAAMRDAALFYSDYLTEDPATGLLISTPSNSPEQGGLVAGPTMDHQIIRSLFRACIEASQTISLDPEVAARLRSQVDRIAPNRIGKYGQLQEWLEDKDDPKNQHRHVSHLWGVYPGCDITWRETPELFAAARQSLLFRGDAATGWSMGWKVNLWARFLDGDHAHAILSRLLMPIGSAKGAGGLYPNLFDAHPPFQIDGNFGATAGIAEMLLQSHLREADGRPLIHLLPALPKAWPEGSFKGLRARGGFTVDASWRGGRLVLAELAAPEGGAARLKVGEEERDIVLAKGERYTFAPATAATAASPAP